MTAPIDIAAARAAWSGLDAACSGLLASQCNRHAPYMGCAMDCNDVENALVPEFAAAAAIIPAALDAVDSLTTQLAEARKEVERLLGELEIGDEVFEAGHWRGCSGCHELSEGHSTGPWSTRLRCNLGTGCHECGGIGAVWEQHEAGGVK